MNRLLCLLLFSPIFSKAQISSVRTPDVKGIQWSVDQTWEQIKDKAKKENKYIFLDCYATWCLPCKQMDRKVYVSDTVGDLMNISFISVKIQFDTARNDDLHTRNWYATANYLQNKYRLKGYPTFLFFTPEGDLIHRDIGYKNIPEFIQLIEAAIDPKRKEVYKHIEDYKKGVRNYQIMPDLVIAVKELFGDYDLAFSMAKDYKVNFLDRQSDQNLFTRDNLQFIRHNFQLLHSTDRIFRLIYEQRQNADTLMKERGMAKRLINYVIYTEEIQNKIWVDNQPVANNPDWAGIYKTIVEKYSESFAKELVPRAEFSYYQQTNNWQEYTKKVDAALLKYPPDTLGNRSFSRAIGAEFGSDAWALNAAAWAVFKNSFDKRLLQKALSWSELSLKLGDDSTILFQYYDTKANLLYKLGRLQEAIACEMIALEACKQAFDKQDNPVVNEYVETVSKMKKGLPTWKITEK